MRRHLAVFAGVAAEKVLTGGKKVDVRLSRMKIVPFGRISTGDIVWMRKPGEKLVGSFIVGKVIYFDHPTTEDLKRLKNDYGKEMAMAEQFWANRKDCKYATVIFIDSSTRFLVSPQINKKDRRSWVVL